jgi:hypothetical protein
VAGATDDVAAVTQVDRGDPRAHRTGLPLER